MKSSRRIGIVGMAWIVVCSPAIAASSHSGKITGVFESPVLAGSYLAVGTHLPVVRDDTSTVVVSGLGTSTVVWTENGAGTAAPSALTFTGNAYDDVGPDQIFPLGTLNFFNGLNSPAALIFGLTMRFSAGDDGPSLAVPVDIVSTQNGGVDRAADADLLSFANLAVPSTLAAFENMAVGAIVYGRFANDAALEITSIALMPGEAAHGCVDEGAVANVIRPCASACGDVCAAIGLALSGPLCGSERLPAVVARRMDASLRLLRQGAGARRESKAQRAVAQAMKQLRKSRALVNSLAKRGRISTSCAAAFARAAANARSQAEPMIATR